MTPEERFTKSRERDEKLRTVLNRIQTDARDTAERDRLMPLWAHLGDHTEFYLQAFNAATAYIKARTKLIALVESLPSLEVRVILYRALAAECADQANYLEACAGAKRQIMAENPLPGDHA